MKNLRRVLYLFVAISMILCVSACGKKADENETSTFETVELDTKEEVTTEEKKEDPKVPANINPLTGLACDESLVGQRPIGFMFNNIRQALPQVGISKCDILYEVLAEGGIVRFEGLIFDYANAGNLGSVRSSRPYYINIARAYDAIYVHAGCSNEASDLLRSSGIDHFDGVGGAFGCGNHNHYNFSVNGKMLYWRDQGRINSGYSLEHTMFSNGALISEAVGIRGFRKTLNDPFFTAFNFDNEFKTLGTGKTANYIKIPQSTYYLSEFNYDTATGLYAHKQYGQKHIDGGTGEQLKFDNVFILFAQESIMSNGKTLEINLTGEGKGYYANGGEYVDIIWKRADNNSPFKYYTADGNELKVDTGKSYVSIFDVKNASAVAFS